MPDKPRRAVAVHFDEDVWIEEVGRYRRLSPPASAAVRARREISDETKKHRWLPCARRGEDHTRLERCVKIYVPLDETPSAAPYGFVFELVVQADRPVAQMLAYGERHPADRKASRSVYERAHKRLHGHWPT